MGKQETFTVFSRISRLKLRNLINAALDEDIGSGDITSKLLIPQEFQTNAKVLVKTSGILSGSEVFKEVFSILDPAIKIDILLPDGSQINSGAVPIQLSGNAKHILAGERTALNFLQRMSGIATATARLVSIAKRYGVQINHIRKTTPLLRALEIYSVRTGGGAYNRSGLFDGILIKDNHLILAKKMGLSLPEVVGRCRIDMPHTIKIGLEITSLAELNDAIQAKPDYLILDNMTLDEITKAVKYTNGRIPIDVTGSVNISNLENIAATGVNMVGVGSITHSAPSLDMSMEIEPD